MIRTSAQPKDHFEGRWKKGKKYTLYAVVVNNGTKFRSVTPKEKDEPYVIYNSETETFSANAGWEIVEMSEDSRLSAMGGNGGGSGKPGEPGKDAGFGTISASVANTSGTPSVVVETSGPDTAKNIKFKFFGLKGSQGPQGAQGNTGSSVAYPFELVNNLNTDDATKALSAAQGVVLDGKVTQLEHEVHNMSGKYYGLFVSPASLPEGDVVGYAFVGANEPFAIYNFDGEDWADSGAEVTGITVMNIQARALTYTISGPANPTIQPGDFLTEEEFASRYLTTGKNLFTANDPDYLEGYRLAPASPVAAPTSAVSGFIPFTQEMMYMCASVNGGQTAGGYGIAVYDSGKNVVAAWSAEDKDYAEWQNGVAYARFSLPGYAAGNIQIEIGKVHTTYEPYSYGIGGSKLTNLSITNDKIADGTIGEEKLASPVLKYGGICYSALGGNARTVKAATLANDTLTLTDFPRYLKRSRNVSFSAKVSTFGSVRVGANGGVDAWNKSFVEVNSTNIVLYYGYKGDYIITQQAHGLTISTFIKVAFAYRNTDAIVTVTTLSGSFTHKFDNARLETYGFPFAAADASTSLTDVVLSAGSGDLKKPIWMFGDSFVSLYDVRWPWHLITAEADNYALFGLAGAHSGDMYAELLLALETNRPKFVVWTLGMNDADTTTWGINSAWYNVFIALEALCESLGIELIAATVPNVPERIMTDKNAYIRESGHRYIDFASAVGANEAGSSWYAGCLSSDDVHPTVLGAQVLASQVLADFPELIDQTEL